MQQSQKEWEWQWSNLNYSNQWLFEDWIYPNTLDEFRGKTVLDAGCGGGHHMRFTSPYAETVYGVDLNAVAVAKKRNPDLRNAVFIDGDIACLETDMLFDVIYCVGVAHHTDDPDKSITNLKKLLKPGGATDCLGLFT